MNVIHKIHDRLSIKGFTLIEMSIVLVIFGFILTMTGTTLSLYEAKKRHTRTLEALEINKNVLADFVVLQGRYPCPADPTLAPTHPDYGYEANPCGSGGPANALSWNDGYTVNPGTRAIGSDGSRRALSANWDEGLGKTAEPGNDRLLFGAVPFKTILAMGIQHGFSSGSILDGEGNKITYAVPWRLTNTSTFDDTYGSFDVYDEFGNSLLDAIDSSGEFLEDRAAHIVLVSHGNIDAKGAYTENGSSVVGGNCTISIRIIDPNNPPPPAAPIRGVDGDQSDNCDNNDEFFLGGLRTDDDDNFNDDTVRFFSMRAQQLWQFTGVSVDIKNPALPDDDIVLFKMANTNPGNVGIGISMPRDKVHVVGDVKTAAIMADQYCDKYGQNCFSADVIAGEDANMKCPDGEAIKSIGRVESDGDIKVVCEKVFKDDLSTLVCPDPTEYMYGISSTRGALCRPL